MKIAGGVLWLAAASAMAAAACYVGFVIGRQAAKPEEAAATGEAGRQATAPGGQEESAAPLVKVKTAAAGEGRIGRTITAYGTVVAAPEEVRTVSVPFESRVTRIHVIAGQRAAAGTKLVEVEPSPDAALSLQEARNSKESTAKALARKHGGLSAMEVL